MSQTIVDISLMKDRDSANAVDAVSQIVSDAGFVSGGSQTTSVVGVAGRKVTTSTAASLISEVASGTDAAINISVQPKGTGVFAAGGSSVASASLQVTTVTSAVDFINITGAATANPATVTLAAAGTDSNVNTLVTSLGTGVVALGGTTVASSTLQAVTTASNVDFLQVTGSATGNPGSVTLAAAGTDSNIDLVLTSKGTGVLKMGIAGQFAANGSVATAMSSLGPAGSHTTIQKWLIVKDSTNTTLWIPCF